MRENILLIPGIYCVSCKGAPARESRTGTRLVSPASGREKKKWTPPEQGLRMRN